MSSPAQTKAVTKYIKNHTRRYVVQCNNKTDADMIAFLERIPNRNKFIKDLIRAEMERTN